MKVLQLIDSLHAGGAERVAVNFANSLVPLVDTSFLCATRAEGLLKDHLLDEVSYFFLGKKSAFDIKALKTLNAFIKANKIAIVHAHASSFFMGTLVKLLNPKLILVWHDHYGNSEQLKERPTFVLKCCSKVFNHVVAVNTALVEWSKTVLCIYNVSYVPNFAVYEKGNPVTQLKGQTTKRIVCLANFREQKDHSNLLHAFKHVVELHPDWTLHLVGGYDEDAYYHAIKQLIEASHLENHVFIYGSCSDVFNILSQSTIGVLASKSEGLPVALLEYGLAKLPVIATRVGDCEQVITDTKDGLLVAAENHTVLAEALLRYINDLDLRMRMADQLYLKVRTRFSEANTMALLLDIYKTYQK